MSEDRKTGNRNARTLEKVKSRREQKEKWKARRETREKSIQLSTIKN